VEANRRAANAVERDEDGTDGKGGTENDSTENEDRNSAVALQQQQSGRSIRNGQRGPPGRRIGLYASAINKGKGKSPAKSPMRSSTGKGAAQVRKTENSTASPLPDNATVAINTESTWPTGTRKAFSAAMPLLYDKVFGSSTPLRVAHLVVEQLRHCPVLNADAELAATLMKGAFASHISGYSLMSGTVSAAQVSYWICSAMPSTLRPVLLSSVALSMETLVRRKRTF